MCMLFCRALKGLCITNDIFANMTVRIDEGVILGEKLMGLCRGFKATQNVFSHFMHFSVTLNINDNISQVWKTYNKVLLKLSLSASSCQCGGWFDQI